ncbi:MAG: hypothetical protein K2P59_14850 [Acetatifactor sp.]|nr:hypothetical protein [Acetatifactor sp.]
MFLGSNSITALRHFLDGYQAAEREYAVCRKGELFPLPFQYMHEYVGYRLKERNNMGWTCQILNACGGAEDVALQKFFEFYDEFRQIRMRRYWKAVLSEDNIARHDQVKCVSHSDGTDVEGDHVMNPAYRNPLAVYVMELTIPVCIFAVETETDLCLARWFFTSAEKAKRAGMFPRGVEACFGPVDVWKEFSARNISFDKKFDFVL